MTPPPLVYKAIAKQWLLSMIDGGDTCFVRAKAQAFVRIQEVVG